MPKTCLTPEVVDALTSPTNGERWLGDNHVQHFGVRTWAGKKGGGKAYGIRLRDQFGFLVRETFDPASDYRHYRFNEGWHKSLGYFLEAARAWARDRIAIHLGLETSADRQRRTWQNRKGRILATTIGEAFNQRIRDLRQKSRNHLYVDHLQNLVGIHVSPEILGTTFRDVPIRRLADAISKRNISYGNVKALRAFVGGVFKRAASRYGPLNYKLESIQRRCLHNLDARKAPPYPQILEITDQDYSRFFEALERDPCWRQSLAIRLYFATGAKLPPLSGKVSQSRRSSGTGNDTAPYSGGMAYQFRTSSCGITAGQTPVIIRFILESILIRLSQGTLNLCPKL